jgi:D-allose transport system permease protein
MGFNRVNASINKGFPYFWKRYGTFVIFFLLLALISILAPSNSPFLSRTNLINMLYQSTDKIAVGLGEFFVILIAGIDLSIGSILALCGMVLGMLLRAGNPLGIALAACIFAGIILGTFNGVLVNFTGVHPFIITLGTQWIFRGIVYIISGARSVTGFPPIFKQTINYKIGGIVPVVIIAILVFAAILWFISVKTKLGRNLFAMGGNKEAAWFSGINTKIYTVIAFMLCGICSAFAAIIITAKTGSAEPLAGNGYETFAIAAAFIGGASFYGGKGKTWNVVVGGLVIGLINNGLNMMRVDSFYQNVVMGALIIAAVTLDTVLLRKK